MNKVFKPFRDFWKYLKRDTWDSWIVSLILAFVIIKFVFFPFLSLATAAPLPLVVVESCSMYHDRDFDAWWDNKGVWYEDVEILKEDFKNFPFIGGLNKGDIVLVSGRGEYEIGDIIVFDANHEFPLIHRVVEKDPRAGTKGDNNFDQLNIEKEIRDRDILGKAVARIPGLGWAKLIFFESRKAKSDRGFCK